MPKLLLVEDDLSLGSTLKERLSREGHSVTWCETLGSALETVANSYFDLFIIDINLRDGDGFSLATELKKTSRAPFIFLTAMNSAEFRLKGYELGAEDYIPKPFHLRELLLRINRVLQKSSQSISIGNGRLDIDLQAGILKQKDGQVEHINPRELTLLKLLIARAPQIVSREDLLASIVESGSKVSHRIIDNSIVRLRQLLNDPEHQCIKSVRGIGYQWCHGLR